MWGSHESDHEEETALTLPRRGAVDGQKAVEGRGSAGSGAVLVKTRTLVLALRTMSDWDGDMYKGFSLATTRAKKCESTVAADSCSDLSLEVGRSSAESSLPWELNSRQKSVRE